jgi:methionyl-tRNA synthetase
MSEDKKEIQAVGESASAINYISKPAPDDAEYSATCSICGAAAKPGGKCLSCGELAPASEGERERRSLSRNERPLA